MSASVNDKLTDTRNAARPNSARVSSGRSAGGTTLSCDNLTGWPTASKVHFVTYRLDSSSNPVAGTQIDWYGIVSGNDIGSLTAVDGTDTGNSINDVVEMLPTAAWGQGLADWGTTEHNRNGTHGAVTATSLTTTAAVTVGSGLIVSAGAVTVPASSIATAALVGVDKSLITTDSNPYKFSAYKHTGTQSASTTDKVTYETELFDTNNNFASSTYTAPVSGFYLFIGTAFVSSTTTFTYLDLYKNGSAYQLPPTPQNTAGDLGTGGQWFLQLTAADTIDLRIIFSGGGTRTIQHDTALGQIATSFSGFLMCRT